MKKVNDNTNMTKPQGSKILSDSIVRAYRIIKADESGELPTRIMLIKAGEWPDSCKGNLSISINDLKEMKRNFDAGHARPGQGLGLPIDFSHNEWNEAAGWIDGLKVEGDALFADPVDWSTKGKEAILGKMFKCISPSFYPTGRGGYTDPENLNTSIENVLVGAGLTNIPFFKGLSPVKASANSSDDDSIIYIKQGKQAKEKIMPTLDETRIKVAADLTADEKQLLADNKAQLSAEELTKFGLTADVDASASPISAEDAKILADIKAGTVKVVAADAPQVTADQVAKLQATAEAYEKEKAEKIVADHVKRGAIKADQAGRWAERLLKADAESRTELETDLAALPDNENINKEIGSSNDPAVEADSRAEIAKLAAAKVTAATAEGKELSFIDAQNQVLAENPELAARDRESIK